MSISIFQDPNSESDFLNKLWFFRWFSVIIYLQFIIQPQNILRLSKINIFDVDFSSWQRFEWKFLPFRFHWRDWEWWWIRLSCPGYAVDNDTARIKPSLYNTLLHYYDSVWKDIRLSLCSALDNFRNWYFSSGSASLFSVDSYCCTSRPDKLKCIQQWKRMIATVFRSFQDRPM